MVELNEMTNKTRLAAVANTLAPALGILQELGYVVTRDKATEPQYQAENDSCIFIADDLLTLLGLVKIYETRGAAFQPSDDEVQRILLLESDDDEES